MTEDKTRAERVHDRNIEFMMESGKAAIDFGLQTVKAFLLINGGAAIAVLAFAGSLTTIEGHKLESGLEPLAKALLWFAWGAALAAAATGFAYLTNYSLASMSSFRKHSWDHPYLLETEKSKSWGHSGTLFQVFAILAVLASVFAFMGGVFSVNGAIKEISKTTMEVLSDVPG